MITPIIERAHTIDLYGPKGTHRIVEGEAVPMGTEDSLLDAVTARIRPGAIVTDHRNSEILADLIESSHPQVYRSPSPGM